MQNQTNPKPSGAMMAKLVLVVAVIVSLGAALGVAGYLAKNKPVKIQQPQVSPAAKPAKSVESETADWKTYRNEEYGFEVKYPNQENYTIEDYPKDTIIFGDANIQAKHIIISQPHPGNRIHVYITADKNIIDFLQQDGAFEEKTINNNKFYEFYATGMGNGYGYMTQKDSNYYIFESVWGPENEDFETIVKTFKFTNN